MPNETDVDECSCVPVDRIEIEHEDYDRVFCLVCGGVIPESDRHRNRDRSGERAPKCSQCGQTADRVSALGTPADPSMVVSPDGLVCRDCIEDYADEWRSDQDP